MTRAKSLRGGQAEESREGTTSAWPIPTVTSISTSPTTFSKTKGHPLRTAAILALHFRTPSMAEVIVLNE